MHAAEIHPGDVIAGKYRVRAILGRSHGLVVDAFHTEFDQRVIIKLLLAGHGDEREIERFRREARTLAKLESEHAARIIDVGTEPDGSFYLVRQYLEGVDLATYLRQNGPLPLDAAVLTILMVAEAVAETHSHGIIVRELQPGHLFLTQRPGGAPLVKIADFGTAKLMRDAAAPGLGGELTATAMFGLSPYSSPELVRKARDVDVRTDIWSLGAILYELVTGRAPFGGEATALMLQIMKEEPTPASYLAPGVPAEIDQIIGWALAKDVDSRFKNVHAFAHALRPYAGAEAQMLIDRIGQIAESSRQKRRGGSVPPPAFPSARPPPPSTPSMPRPVAALAPAVEIDDAAATGVRVAPATPTQTLDVGGSLSAAPSSRPAGQPVGSSWATSSPPVASGPPSQTATIPPPPPAGKLSPERKLAFGALAIAAVLLPLLIVLVFLKQSHSATDEATATSATAAATASAPAPVAATETAPAPAAAAPSDTASAAPVEPVASVTAVPTAEPVAEVKTKRGSKPAPAPAPPPPAPAPAAGGANGTLLAVAVGGTCSFSVNGAGKGTSSSIRLSLKPGTYSVTCRPASGATKSKSVTVKSGETAMAAFKL